MFTIQQSVTIARPVEEVFAFLTDPASIPRWRPDVIETRSGGPLQAGSEFDEILNFAGRKTQTFRVTVFEANKTLEVAAIAGLGIRPTQRYSISSNAGSTMVSIRVTVRAQGLFRVMEPLLPRMIASKWRDYSARLRELLETQPVVMSGEAQVAEA
jgi:uncharacterized protein YndB with AHSA1/START domain